MARKSKQEKLFDIHEEALREFELIQTALRDERMQCLQDRRFYSIAGAQWEGPLGNQFENKPKFEVNKIHLSVMRIINEYRNNRITVNFVSKDGNNSNELADICSSLYRADEQDSIAEEAYDNAFEEGVGGGFGAWRLRSEYEDEEDEEDERQRIRIEPIFDADSSVFFDLNSKRQDKSDAKFAFIVSSMTYDAFKSEYGQDPAAWPKIVTQRQFDWLTPDIVYVAEYYKIEFTTETILTYEGLTGEEKRVSELELEENPELGYELESMGFREIKQRKLKKKKVHKYIMCGKCILEDCGYIAGKNIPIVPFYGKRWFIDNIERCMGHVRLAKDSQRLKNMQISKLGEISALSSVEKPIFTPEQISSHQVMWSEDNIKNYPYLLVDPITDGTGNVVSIGPASYTKAPDLPAALAALLQLTESDIQDVLGNQKMGERLIANVSDEAIGLVQGKLDMQTFIYISNMARSIKRSGEIWLSMAKEILVEEGRIMKGVGLQGEVTQIELIKPQYNQNEGRIEYLNDLSNSDFDIAVEVGPSSSSRKNAITKALTNILQIVQDPETIQVLVSMILMNLEGEGINDVRSYFRKKLVKLGVVKPTEEELLQLQEEAKMASQQPPDAQTQFLQASAEEATSKSIKAKADTMLSLAKAEESKAKILEILSNVDIDQQNQILKAIKNFAPPALESSDIGQELGDRRTQIPQIDELSRV